MATEEFHQEIEKWNKKENLLELAKYKLDLDSSNLYWSMGIVIAIYLAIFSSREWMSLIQIGWLSGSWLHTIIVSTMSLIVIFIIMSFSKKQKVGYSNISYLSRKLDGQLN